MLRAVARKPTPVKSLFSLSMHTSHMGSFLHAHVVRIARNVHLLSCMYVIHFQARIGHYSTNIGPNLRHEAYLRTHIGRTLCVLAVLTPTSPPFAARPGGTLLRRGPRIIWPCS